jgi:hypothetical protein
VGLIQEVRLFDMILDPKGLPEREGGFRGRGVKRFESANGVLAMIGVEKFVSVGNAAPDEISLWLRRQP